MNKIVLCNRVSTAVFAVVAVVSAILFTSFWRVAIVVRLAMWYCLAVQCVVGLGVALARPSTDGKAGSVMAFAVMVPMLGIGLNGLWAGKFGTFGPRQLKSASE